VVGDFLAHRREAGVQIGQAQQLAVLHVGRVLIVVHYARRVEATGRIQSWLLVFRVARAIRADAGTRVVRHVIDHGVGDDPDTDGIAAIHHLDELGAGARAAVL